MGLMGAESWLCAIDWVIFPGFRILIDLVYNTFYMSNWIGSIAIRLKSILARTGERRKLFSQGKICVLLLRSEFDLISCINTHARTKKVCFQ